MVEIRVAVEDETRVHGLLRRLAALFDASSVSFDRARKEVRVRSHVASRSVVFVAGAVEAWLEEDGLDSTRVSVGEQSYTLLAPGDGR